MSVCPECHRENDDSIKELHKCPLCEREFCSKHIDPKLAFFSASFHTDYVTNKEYRLLIEKEIRRVDAHPCVPYTNKRIEEIRYENERLFERLKNAWTNENNQPLDKKLPVVRTTPKNSQELPEVIIKTSEKIPEITKKPEKKSSIGITKYLVALFIFLIIILIYFIVKARF